MPPLDRTDSWQHLRQLTPARIALGRVGSSVPTRELLDFQLAHARARDAVHAPLAVAALASELAGLGLSTLQLASAAVDRGQFLQRPDLGRQLSAKSRSTLATAVASLQACESPSSRAELVAPDDSTADLAIIVSDGLSALAVERQAVPLVRAWLPLLRAEHLALAPLVIVERGRVAIGDEIGQLLDARVAVILIGERPGLGSPDSLGAYLVYGPRPGRTDAERNCVSNIRPQGLAVEAAALRLQYLVREALARKVSGVSLKDESLLTVDDSSREQIEAPR